MNDDSTARATTRIAAPAEAVWRALTDPVDVKKFYFGTDLKTDWKPGSRITWSGEWQGRKYEDYGKVLEVEPNRRMKYTHFSPLMGKEDRPENYHTITVELVPDGDGTRVTLAQDNNADEKARAESQRNWEMVLDGLKKHVEGEGA
jgi:uncharacterized protein YndB with AHSA1/START domain